jgi:hypothetical protein
LTDKTGGLDLTRTINLLVLLSLVALPFLIFGTSLHVGGDDSHLYYDFPREWIKNLANSSWISNSSVGNEDQYYFFLPILSIFSVMRDLGIPSFVIQNLSFSAILILGFIFFQKLASELISIIPTEKKYRLEVCIGSLVYVLSPIILISPLDDYLAAAWLIGVIPTLLYLLVKYIKTSKTYYLTISGVVSVIFSFALDAVPWLAGFILPVVLACISCGYLLSTYAQKKVIMRRASIWIAVIILCQAFWLVPFLGSIKGGSSLGGRVLSSATTQSFQTTVVATDVGNTIVDPLLNLFHEQIQQQYHWNTLGAYEGWYDHLKIIDAIYPLIIFLGIYLYRKNDNKLFWVIFAAFVLSLFFFTVNIGGLQRVFLLAIYIPGFAMFRNFYDKFALGYALLFAMTITLSLVIIKDRLNIRSVRLAITLLAIAAALINAKPLFSGQIVNAPFGNTNIHTNLTIPSEYLNFMNVIHTKLPPDSNILDVPFGTSSYTIIKAQNTNSAYIGKSPVKLLSGINDFSGTLSFPTPIADEVNYDIEAGNISQLKGILSAMDIRYVLQTNNVPTAILNSSLYNPVVLSSTNKFKDELYGNVIARSTSNHYVLYSVKENAPKRTNSAFAVVKSIYNLSTSVVSDASSGSILPDATSFLLNASNVSIDTTKNIPANDRISLYSPGKSVSTSNAKIFVPNANLYSIEGNNGAILTLSNIADSFYAKNDNPLRAISIPQLSSKSIVLLKIGNQYYSRNSLASALLQSDDSLDLYTKSDTNDFGGLQNIYRTWGRGDCDAYNQQKAIGFGEATDSVSLSLTAESRHNACINKTIRTQTGYAYTVSFQYNTNLSGVGVSVNDGKNLRNTQYESGIPNQWHQFSYTFTGTGNAVKIYLYSGESNGKAVSSFSNINVSTYKPGQTVNLSHYLSQSSNSGSEYSLSDTASTKVPQQNAFMAPLSSWSQGDCADINSNRNEVSFYSPQPNSIAMTARGGHDACTYQSVPIDSHYTYYVSFWYNTNGYGSPPNISYNFDNIAGSNTFLNTTHSKQWRYESIEIDTPRTSSNLSLYLYSGKSTDTAYSDLTLSRSPKTFSDNLLITPTVSAKANDSISLKVKQNAPYKYSLTVASVNNNFLLNFMQPYSSQWTLSTLNKSTDIAPHILVNQYSNGWYIDINKLCVVQKKCQQNANGSYNIKLVAYFSPQKYFYVGSTISSLALLTCISYLSYYFYDRHNQANKHHIVSRKHQ